MEKKSGFWHEVAPSAFILDRDGETIWKVMAERQAESDGRVLPQVLLEQRDGTRKVVWRPDPFTPVDFMIRTIEECEQMIAERCAATLVARREENAKIFDTNALTPKTALPDIRTHMILFHASYVGDIKQRAALMEAHNDHHAESDAGHTLHGYILHRHVPNLRPLGARR